MERLPLISNLRKLDAKIRKSVPNGSGSSSNCNYSFAIIITFESQLYFEAKYNGRVKSCKVRQFGRCQDYVTVKKVCSQFRKQDTEELHPDFGKPAGGSSGGFPVGDFPAHGGVMAAAPQDGANQTRRRPGKGDDRPFLNDRPLYVVYSLAVQKDGCNPLRLVMPS